MSEELQLQARPSVVESRGGSRMPSRPGKATADGATRTCPECRDRLVFSHRYPVLSTGVPRDGSGGSEIGYGKAWVCRNGGCDYRELVDEG
jgi:hypothetical protein